MKSMLTLVVFIVGVSFSYSQNYDLIVNSNGDSIACRIDSVTSLTIFFEMKVYNNWIHTNIDRKSVVEYGYNVIDKDAFVFKRGTSYICQNLNKQYAPNNSLFMGTHILSFEVFYERTILPGNSNYGLITGIGVVQEIGFSDETNLIGEIDFIMGDSKHFIEAGANIVPFKNDLSTVFFDIAFRYQNLKGFMMKIEIAFLTDSDRTTDGEKRTNVYLFPGISFGVTF